MRHDLESFRRERGVTIKWGRKRTWPACGTCRIGSYRAGVIRLHPALKRAPRYVLVWTIYHERLHHRLGLEHTPELVRLERRHRYFRLTDQWLRENPGLEL
jgi:hypothetical protein